MSKKNVYFFGSGKADGNAGMKNLLGGKGANLAEMAHFGAEEQPAQTYNDPQTMKEIGFLEHALQETKKSMKILDYGCGKGPFITEIAKLKQFMKSSHQYIGVNYKSVEAVKRHAFECKLYDRKVPPLFYTTEEFENLKEPINADLIFTRNVTHEIPLKELGKRFYHVLRSLKKGGSLYLLDMCMLYKWEPKKVTWEEDDFALFFEHDSLKVIPNTYKSKSGMPLISVIITKRSDNIPSERDLFNCAVKLFKEKKKRIQKVIELYEAGKINLTKSQYRRLIELYAYTQMQLDEVNEDKRRRLTMKMVN